jgi:hypothetical protein
MDRPRVSIITATFNRGHVLRHTIASVTGQRSTDWNCWTSAMRVPIARLRSLPVSEIRASTDYNAPDHWRLPPPASEIHYTFREVGEARSSLQGG